MTRSKRTPSECDLPRRSTIAAAIRLLGDDSPAVVESVEAMLLQCGEHARESLQDATESCEPNKRVRARELLRSLDVRRDLQRLTVLELDAAAQGRDPEPLLAGAVLSSRLVRTFAPDVEELGARLGDEAAVLRPRLEGRSLASCARILSEHLFAGLGLRGTEGDPLDADHVLLDRVLALRTGAPVSLSIVYLLVARWAGLQATGVAMPDHFLVRLHGVRPVLVDPFHGGRTVTKVDCARYLRSLGFEQVQRHLRDLTDREVLAHYLRSLRRTTAHRGGHRAHRTLGDALLHLEAR